MNLEYFIAKRLITAKHYKSSISAPIIKIAISAPKNVTILRKELYNEVKEENINATEFDKDILKDIKNNKHKEWWQFSVAMTL